jgi:hypothetical protein
LAEALNESLLTADESAKGAPRIRMSEMGYPGLKVVQKQILEECDKNLRMPQLVKTVAQMKKDPTVSAALGLYKFTMARVPWYVKAPIGATEQQKERAKFIESCMSDMNHSWFDFIVSVMSMIEMGFCINEIVLKKRSFANSKFDDGLVGWGGLPSRSQSTIDGWVFSADGRTLVGVEQSTKNLYQGERYVNLATADGTKITIPRDKFLLFRTDPENDNPEGTSCLKSAYSAWRMKHELEQRELIGADRDLTGLLKLSMPARYLSPDASTGEQAVAQNFQKVCRNVSQGEQSGIILPSDCDETTKQRLFDAELLSSQNAGAYDTSEIITRYTTNLLIALYADVLQLGNNATGSFALAGSKQNLLSYALDYRLKEIANVLNQHLVKLTFEMNQWDDKELPEICFGEIDPIDLETWSKAVQRLAATSSIEKDRPFYNKVRVALGIDPYPEDEEVHTELLNDATSRSGDSFNTPSAGLNGTANSVSQDNTSDLNTENAG